MLRCMTTQRRTPIYQPTWRRVTGGSFAVFAVVLAFLGGRMQAGGDPGLSGAPDTSRQKAAVSSTSSATSTPSSTSSDSTDDGETSDDGTSYSAPSTPTYSDPSPMTTHTS